MTRRTARRKAAALGHSLSRFARQNSHMRPNITLYYIAHCDTCGAACFAEQLAEGNDYLCNPALSQACTKPAPAAGLLTEQNTERVRTLVSRAARARFGRGKARPVFEHGQWWVTFYDKAEERDVVYSVIDAQPSIADTGFDFEQC